MAKFIKADILVSYPYYFSMPSKDTTNKIVAAAAFVIIVGGVASYSYIGQQATPLVTPTTQSTAMVSASPSSVTATTIVSTPTSVSTATYKNGSYSAEGAYTSPGGAEHIDVSLTLANGVITDVQVTPKATIPMSQRFQGLFVDNYKQYVVGKKLDEVNLTKVAGSSLTPKGFADALAKIKTEAKA